MLYKWSLIRLSENSYNYEERQITLHYAATPMGTGPFGPTLPAIFA